VIRHLVPAGPELGVVSRRKRAAVHVLQQDRRGEFWPVEIRFKDGRPQRVEPMTQKEASFKPSKISKKKGWREKALGTVAERILDPKASSPGNSFPLEFSI